jgi:pyruvate formate lyase activating enzyme
VPLHFVRFHPDYRMRHGERTPIPRLLRARAVAREMGARRVYLGNVYDTPFADSRCDGCDALLVTRYGTGAQVVGLNGDGRCAACERASEIVLLPARLVDADGATPAPNCSIRTHVWHGDVRSLHVHARNRTAASKPLLLRPRRLGSAIGGWRVVGLAPQESHRFLVGQASVEEVAHEVAVPHGVDVALHEVLDRAHFPVAEDARPGPAPVPVS